MPTRCVLKTPAGRLQSSEIAWGFLRSDGRRSSELISPPGVLPFHVEAFQGPAALTRREVAEVEIVRCDVDQKLAVNVSDRPDVVAGGQHKLVVEDPATPTLATVRKKPSLKSSVTPWKGMGQS
eukprot:scaffold513299_cov26-Prasinocladus_malaysianus.AAC.1